MQTRLHVLNIATGFTMNLPKVLLQDSNRRLAELKLEACGVPDLLQTWAEYYFEPLAEDIAVVDELNHRGFVPDGCLGEVLQGGVCLPRLLEDMPSAMGQVSAHDLDIWSVGVCKS